MKISWPIHSDNQLPRKYVKNMCMLERPIIELSLRDPYCNAKMKTAWIFVVLRGIKVSDDILIANLVSTSGRDCPSKECHII